MDIQELKTLIISLKSRLDEIKENVFKIIEKEQRLTVIESELLKEEVWSDLELSQKLSKEKTVIEKTLTSYNNVANKLSD